MNKTQIALTTVYYTVLSFLGLNASNAIWIFGFGQFERKFGALGTWQIGALILAYAIPCSALGFALAVTSLWLLTYMSTINWRPLQLAGLAAALLTLLSTSRILFWAQRVLMTDNPGAGIQVLLATHAVAGFLVGGTAVVILWMRNTRTA
jgi:hypothetical protein